MTRHKYGIVAVLPKTSLRGEISGGVVKSRLFSQDIQYVTGLFFSCNFKIILKLFLDHDICQHEKFRKTLAYSEIVSHTFQKRAPCLTNNEKTFP